MAAALVGFAAAFAVLLAAADLAGALLAEVSVGFAFLAGALDALLAACLVAVDFLAAAFFAAGLAAGVALLTFFFAPAGAVADDFVVAAGLTSFFNALAMDLTAPTLAGADFSALADAFAAFDLAAGADLLVAALDFAAT